MTTGSGVFGNFAGRIKCKRKVRGPRCTKAMSRRIWVPFWSDFSPSAQAGKIHRNKNSETKNRIGNFKIKRNFCDALKTETEIINRKLFSVFVSFFVAEQILNTSQFTFFAAKIYADSHAPNRSKLFFSRAKNYFAAWLKDAFAKPNFKEKIAPIDWPVCVLNDFLRRSPRSILEDSNFSLRIVEGIEFRGKEMAPKKRVPIFEKPEQMILLRLFSSFNFQNRSARRFQRLKSAKRPRGRKLLAKAVKTAKKRFQPALSSSTMNSKVALGGIGPPGVPCAP